MNGVVIKVSSAKTAVVRVERVFTHPIYKKYKKVHSNFMVHDELGVSVGDKVTLKEISPISKRKKHKIEEKL